MPLVKVNAMSHAKLIKALQVDMHTAKDLAAATGLHYSTVREQLRALHRERLIYIAAYEKDVRGRENAMLWAWGNRPDAKRVALTPSQRQQRLRNRRRMAKLLSLIREPA